MMIDLEALGRAVNKKRGTLSLREQAKRLHMSYTSLWRVENCKSVPGVDAYAALCDWLGVSMEHFRTNGRKRNTGNSQQKS